MTEKRAKEILDFIAKRSGWLSVSMRDGRFRSHDSRFALYLESRLIASPIWIDYVDNPNCKIIIEKTTIEYNKLCSWSKVLRDLFKTVNEKCVSKLTDGCHKAVLFHGESLESIIVAMELNDV